MELTLLQKCSNIPFKGLTGVKNIADEIIIFGSTRSEHDKNLDECLERLTTKGLRLIKVNVLF